jgi:hypothetical protein
VLGRVLSTNSGAGTYPLLLAGPEILATASTGNVNGQAITPSSLNNELYIDGNTNTSPQSIYNTGYGGQLIHWTNPPGTPVIVSGNAWGNTNTLGAPTVTFATTGCTGHVPNSSLISVKLVAFDKLGDINLSMAVVNASTPGSGSNCLRLTPPPEIAAFPGLFGYAAEGCAGSDCSNYTVLASGASYGPFSPNLGSARTYDWSTDGPIEPPANTTGLVVSNATIEFGVGPFMISVPQVPGNYSGARGYKRDVSLFQVSPSFPAGIPQLMEPWGQPTASSAGTVG